MLYLCHFRVFFSFFFSRVSTLCYCNNCCWWNNPYFHHFYDDCHDCSVYKLQAKETRYGHVIVLLAYLAYIPTSCLLKQSIIQEPNCNNFSHVFSM